MTGPLAPPRTIEPGRSLYWRIIIVIAAGLGLGAVSLGAAAWFYARLAADDAYDRLLVGAALQIAETISAQGGVFAVDPPVSAFELLALSEDDRIFYKVTDTKGLVLTGYDDLVPRRAAPPATEPALSNGDYRGFPVRIVVVSRYISDPSAPGWAQVTVAQTREARFALARDLTAKALALLLAMTGLAFVGVLFAIRRALEPLARVERELRGRDPKDLKPLDVETPPEIFTLVSSINRFMERLAQRIAVMQRFIADAAHQIRTPLAGLASQVDLLHGESRPERRDEQLERVRARTMELGRLTNQLLSHAMIIHRAEVAPFEVIDLVALARQTLINCVPLALDRDVEIGFDDATEPVRMEGDAVSLREALANVIHNGLKHGARTWLRVRVSAEGEWAAIEVAEDGPGIPASQWQRVREPFYSPGGTGTGGPESGGPGSGGSGSEGSGSEGSGLGLAIAADVMRAHGGELRFSHRPDDAFAVILRLRRLRPAAGANGHGGSP